jgi:uncharacterized metal-binding protein
MFKKRRIAPRMLVAVASTAPITHLYKTSPREAPGKAWWRVLFLVLLTALTGRLAYASTSLTTANLSANQVTLQITSANAGLASLTVLQGASVSCGTSAQIAAGQDSTGAAAGYIGSLTLASGVAGNYTVRNLAQSTAYTACIADAGGNIFSAGFTTTGETIGTTWTTVGAADFSASEAVWPTLAFAPDGTPYVAYEDCGNNCAPTVMKYNGTSWVLVGAAITNSNEGGYTSLAFAPDGTPYIVYQDCSNNCAVAVMKFDGSNWVAVGSESSNAGGGGFLSLAFAPDGTPYVAYEDCTNNCAATVIKYNGTSWALVGAADFSGSYVNYLSLAFAPNGVPYVGYTTDSEEQGGVATVMTYNGSSWSAVGAASLSATSTDYLSLAIAPNGTPYIAYEDCSNNCAATVMAYNGTSWALVGAADFSSVYTNFLSVAIAPDGVPYVAYDDCTNNCAATVMKFNGSSWVLAGAADFSVANIDTVNLAIAPNGTPYVAYMDCSNNCAATVQELGIPTPTATTSAATSITPASATLNGTVNDNGFATTASFEYGTTTSYGTTVAATTGGSIAAGTGATATAVSLTGLSASTTYHFRVDATYTNGTVNGSDLSFTTAAQTTQTISFTAPASPVNFTKGLTIPLSAQGGGSGNAVVFSLDATSTGTGTISGTKLIVTGAGTLVIDANQAGNASYSAASQVQQSVVVTAATQTINFTAPQSPVNFTKGLTIKLVAQGGGSGNAVVFSLDAASTGTGTISGTKLIVTGAGTLVIDANQAGNGNYSAASQVQQSVVVNKIAQVIDFTEPKSPEPFTKNLTIKLVAQGGGSGNAVVYSLDATSTGTGTISGKKLTVTGAGTLVIDANQAGNNYYDAAPQVQAAVEVDKIPQIIVFAQPKSPVTYHKGLVIPLVAHGGDSSAPVVFSLDGTSTATGTISGNKLTVTSAGNLVIDANQAATVNRSAAQQVQRKVVVTPAS